MSDIKVIRVLKGGFLGEVVVGVPDTVFPDAESLYTHFTGKVPKSPIRRLTCDALASPDLRDLAESLNKGYKIAAIKAVRAMSVNRAHGGCTIGLREAKDLVDMIARLME